MPNDHTDLRAAFKQATADGDPLAKPHEARCPGCQGEGTEVMWPAFGGGPRTVLCWECEGTGINPRHHKENP